MGDSDKDAIDYENYPHAITLVISCAASIEAFVNGLSGFKYYDNLNLRAKIEFLYYINKLELNWGAEPFQSFLDVCKIRNWVLHFKDIELGLSGSLGFIQDANNKLPRIDPFEVFSYANCKRYYDQTRALIVEIGKRLNQESFTFDFAVTEKYEYFMSG
jgi:hypothetical protein